MRTHTELDPETTKQSSEVGAEDSNLDKVDDLKEGEEEDEESKEEVKEAGEPGLIDRGTESSSKTLLIPMILQSQKIHTMMRKKTKLRKFTKKKKKWTKN